LFRSVHKFGFPALLRQSCQRAASDFHTERLEPCLLQLLKDADVETFAQELLLRVHEVRSVSTGTCVGRTGDRGDVPVRRS
jgi:hypothetical protein